MRIVLLGWIALALGCAGPARPAGSPPPAPLARADRAAAASLPRRVWITAPDDAWAITSDRSVLRWDGRAWAIALDAPGQPRFREIWASGRDEVWVIGARPARTERFGDVVEDTPSQSEVLRWNGAAWAPVPLPPLGARVVSAIHGSAPDDLWLATIADGPEGEQPSPDPALLLRWDGARWSPHELPALRSIKAVWARSRTEAWLVGTVDRDPALWRWDGRAWQRDAAIAAAHVWGDASGTWASTRTGEVWHRAGPGWKLAAPALPGTLHRLVGGDGPPWLRTRTELLAWRDRAWKPVEIPPGFEPRTIGSRDGEAWIVGTLDREVAALHLSAGRSTLHRELVPAHSGSRPRTPS